MSRKGTREDIYRMIGASNHSNGEREKDDFYATDPVAIDKLLAADIPCYNIWECACGAGHLSKRLKELGHNVYSSDLINRGYGESGIDFLKTEATPFNGDCDIITNPPYKYAEEFILHALSLPKHNVYMLLRLNFLEGRKRYESIWSKHPPQKVMIFTKRLNCAKNGDFITYPSKGAVAYAWFKWVNNFKEQPVIEWI